MIERTLSKGQGRAVLALVREREELTRAANEQIAEINAALQEQAETLRAVFGLPEGQYRFEGDASAVRLVSVEEAALAADSPVKPEQADVS